MTLLPLDFPPLVQLRRRARKGDNAAQAERARRAGGDS